MNGNCEVGIKNCRTYRNEKECLECKDDYSLIFGQCRHNLLLGCRSEKEGHSCSECFPPFQLNINHCDIPFCKKFNDFGCVKC